jgi:hypothetical protein
MRKKITIIISALVFMTSCASTKRHNYILLIDNSKTISDETLNRYINIIQQNILPSMGRYDCITIEFVDECSMTKAERVFNLDLATMDFTNKSDGMNHEKDSSFTRMKRFITDSIQPNVRNIILAKRLERRNCGNFTDIINALNETAPLITHNKSYASTFDEVKNSAQGKENYSYENIFILMSDMVNENRDRTMDFTQMGKYNGEKIQSKIEELRKLNKIPDLSGCQVFVYGATSTVEAGAFANKQIENCKLFWQVFFSDCGADLKAYSFDSKKEILDYMIAANK